MLSHRNSKALCSLLIICTMSFLIASCDKGGAGDLVVCSTYSQNDQDDFEGLPDPICEATGNGRCFYIASDGNDSASGDFEHPWATIAYAAAHTSAGDYVYLREGNYAETMYGVTFNSGSEDGYITYSGYRNESVTWDMTHASERTTLNLDGRAYLRFKKMKLYNSSIDDGVVRMRFGCHHISFEDLEIQGNGSQGAVVFMHGLGTENHHINISNCDIHDNNPDPTGYDCIGVFDTDYLTVENSKIHNCGHSGIMIVEGSDNAEVFCNEIYGDPEEVWGSGIIAGGLGETGGHHIHHNIIHDVANSQCAKCAIQWTASDSIIENNIIYSTGRKGISLENGDANNNIFRHNTIYDSGKYPGPGWSYSEQEWLMCVDGDLDLLGAPPIHIGEITGYSTRNNQFYDNLVYFSGVEDYYGVTGYGFWQVSNNSTRPPTLENSLYNNIIYHSGADQPVIYFNDGQDRDVTAEQAEDLYPVYFYDNIQEDPVLSNPEGRNFAPSPGSPACGNASDGTDIGALPCGSSGTFDFKR